MEIDHGAITAAGLHQFIVAALLGDTAVLEDEDSIGIGDGAESVGDDEAGTAGHEGLQTALDEPF